MTHKKPATKGHNRLLSINKNSKAFEFTNSTKNGSVFCKIKGTNSAKFWKFENYILTLDWLLLKSYMVSVSSS